MDAILISIDYRDPAWIAIAFGFGLLCKQINLPPMVGFLAAGFVLHLMGVQNDAFLQAIADLGITLLLFTIGLKLRLDTLLRPEIWATTTIHMGLSIAFSTGMILALGGLGLFMFAGLDFTTALIVAFGLSFSSTVFAVKTLEDRGTLAARYGQVAIGVLVLQDIAAVIFLAVSAGKVPAIWALGLLLLIPGRVLLYKLLSMTGHKELLAIFGFVAALGGAALFEAVGMKGDLGALIFGVLLANHVRTSELAKTLLGFKDVFLVCFFLTIGLTGLPTWDSLLTALVILLFLPLKIILFFGLLVRFRLRARAAGLGALILGNYSEFGLIVGAIAISAGWLGSEWLTVMALALSISFALASPLNRMADSFYPRLRNFLKQFENPNRLPGDENIPLHGNRVLVFGMGRVGKAAYDDISEQVDGAILGVDLDETEVARNVEKGRRVVMGDATHPEFWARVDDGHGEVEMILLAMPTHSANINAAKWIRERGYDGPIVSTAFFPDQEQDLLDAGITQVFNIYAEAGAGAANHVRELMKEASPAE